MTRFTKSFSRCCFPPASRLNSPFSTQADLARPAGPVVTFLSPDTNTSQSAVHFLHRALDFPKLDVTMHYKDRLDQLYSMIWESWACFCPTSGTILHFLSPDAGDGAKRNMNDMHSVHSLISIHGGSLNDCASTNSTHSLNDAVLQSRVRLVEEIQKRQFFQSTSSVSSLENQLRGILIRLVHRIRKHPSTSLLLGEFPTTSNYLPVSLDPKPFNSTCETNIDIFKENNSNQNYKLRELAIPFFPEMSSLQKQLSKSSLSRPIPGLYQYSQRMNANATNSKHRTNDGLILRPLPSAAEDFKLPNLSLVCQCSSLSKAQNLAENELGGKISKIGWRGDGQNGSLILSHPSIRGFDIRLVELDDEWVPNSYFDEAQEALLAASLDDLQSSHVITEGSEESNKSMQREVDPKNLNADCWIETRANVKNPLGFFSKKWSVKSSNKTNVAKPPDLPYE